MGVKEEYVGLFDNKYIASNDEEDFVENLTGVKIKVCFSKVPFWRSVKGTQFMDWIDAKKLADSQSQRAITEKEDLLFDGKDLDIDPEVIKAALEDEFMAFEKP
ncbi:hypothetical protein CROQUDRAFT_99466 [Cronartium quercuum f. sp. fusiforme G11]|uniref:Uncharacterized protein n=1 Tax=Cronartium quercuum f. sp. fusiforme G11 TaxID=708437 RepID=A0A9P6T6X4_9BASI|nr:hypothetical protein CROQUDRAFT_99466 [Cronartium quercuum f. sp. fusiforme G11]